jgi:hypothetical protein
MRHLYLLIYKSLSVLSIKTTDCGKYSDVHVSIKDAMMGLLTKACPQFCMTTKLF